MNKEGNEVLVIGGSYPGAMSAWFRERYPHIAVGSWSSSGVVQPIIDYWQYDDQIYHSTAKSGKWCPEEIQKSMKYVTEEGKKREQGDENNIITKILAGSDAEKMRTDDWMSYYADIFAGKVQYGGAADLCSQISSISKQS